MRPDGTLFMPSAVAGHNWTIGFGNWFGAETLTFAPLASDGGVGPDKDFLFFTNDGTTSWAYLFNHDGELLLPKQPDGGSPELMAATVKYVNDAIGGGATEQQLSNVGGGVELGKANFGVLLPVRTLHNPDGNILIEVDGVDDNNVNFSMIASPQFESLGLTGGMVANSVHVAGGATSDVDPVDPKDLVRLSYFESHTGLVYVNLTGANTINGVKTFNETIQAQGGIGWPAGSIGGSLVLNLTFHSHGEPTTNFDTFDITATAKTLVRKDYVDFLLGGKSDTDHDHGNYLLNTTDTLAGNLTVTGQGFSNQVSDIGDAASRMARKDYVDLVGASDIKLKENIVYNETAGAIDMLYNFPICEWDFKEESGYSGHDYGFIAQEFDLHMPHLITQMGDIKGINYTRLVGTLWAQNKAQQDRLDKLEARLAVLEGILGE